MYYKISDTLVQYIYTHQRRVLEKTPLDHLDSHGPHSVSMGRLRPNSDASVWRQGSA